MTERDEHPSDESVPPGDDGETVNADSHASDEADPKTSEFDERRWGRGHAAVERERAAERREAAAAERERAQASDDEQTRGRRAVADEREHAAAERDDHASERDRSEATADGNRSEADAERRTAHRAQAAEDRHRAAIDRDQTASDRDIQRAAAERRAANRRESDHDREQAAADREAASEDRSGADRDYGLRRDDLRRAQLDQLTGAFGREIGLLLLGREINRARHGNGRLVLAYIDVDGLKQVNDSHGHGAGDALLRDVAAAIQKHLRSYDTLVRVGGDEFVCALGDCTLAVAHRRFAQIRATMHTAQPGASVSVGFADLRPGDTLRKLTERGDVALYEAKRGRGRA